MERNNSKSLRNVGLCEEGGIVGVYDGHSVIEGGVFRLGAVAGDVCVDRGVVVGVAKVME